MRERILARELWDGRVPSRICLSKTLAGAQAFFLASLQEGRSSAHGAAHTLLLEPLGQAIGRGPRGVVPPSFAKQSYRKKLCMRVSSGSSIQSVLGSRDIPLISFLWKPATRATELCLPFR